MGKKQHQKDKLYITYNEWKHVYGGKKDAFEKYDPDKAAFRRLPFYCCSLSLQPFEHPYCTIEGHIFDLMHIVPYLKKYGHNPITGKPLDPKSLVKLTFHKNADDQYFCPVTYKVFTESTTIVTIKTTGNVYSFDAVDRLNVKAKHYKDLLNDEPFARGDIITLQDPTNLDKFNMAKFYHLKKNIKLAKSDDKDGNSSSSTSNLKTINNEAKDILDTLNKEYKPEKSASKPSGSGSTGRDKFNEAHYSTGLVAAGFTSTVMAPQTKQESAVFDEDIVRYRYVKKKGYARIVTSLGDINVELHCDQVPKTCENFVKLAEKGYYNETIFHRSIKHFMIQGGDPTGTGNGGESCWGGAFKDEFRPQLTHTGRGVISMANSGADSNKSQFFITYRSCRHLDQKHSVFGRVVGGLDTLTAMEAVKCDKNDRPEKEIQILSVRIFVNPYDEADEMLRTQREEEKAKQEAEAKAARGHGGTLKQPNFVSKPHQVREGVGKYLNFAVTSKAVDDSDAEPAKKKKRKAASGFGNFDAW